MRTDTTELIHDLHAVGMGIEAGERVPKERFIEAANRLEELQIENGKLFADAMNNTNTEAELRKTKRGLSVEIDLLTEKLAAMDERLVAEMSATQDMEARAMKAERERDELAEKLPRYHDGRAFVPHADEAWSHAGSTGPIRTSLSYVEELGWRQWNGRPLPRLYPTAAECERGEGGNQ